MKSNQKVDDKIPKQNLTKLKSRANYTLESAKQLMDRHNRPNNKNRYDLLYTTIQRKGKVEKSPSCEMRKKAVSRGRVCAKQRACVRCGSAVKAADRVTIISCDHSYHPACIKKLFDSEAKEGKTSIKCYSPPCNVRISRKVLNSIIRSALLTPVNVRFFNNPNHIFAGKKNVNDSFPHPKGGDNPQMDNISPEKEPFKVMGMCCIVCTCESKGLQDGCCP
eukprot:TRINITY_DN13960_c0_g3_i1.p1 TRINITY_DN13960_c0_g3~~TRINITY_DN13960_c0_g3_i1.p1  ORF type:complete len:221 (+),score=7.52 TRINITY_DN13960_c0_g3_i1:397-1059(+)